MSTTIETDLPQVVSRDEWKQARIALMEQEKAHTRARDALSAARRRLPMVEVEKDYVFQGPEGPVTLGELFEGRKQLVVYHFMCAPEWTEGCPGCSLMVDNMGHPAHLHARDTSLVVVARAPLETTEPYRRRMGWTVPWVSSAGSTFNYDFHVSFTGDDPDAEYNYRAAPGQKGDAPGVSVFLRDGERIFHTYSAFARGLEPMMTTFAWLDLTPFGRQEVHEESGRGAARTPGMGWLRRHDRYDAESQ
jgi:predicted dithiol-disulfide oxidoreductase (DUF899 family)